MTTLYVILSGDGYEQSDPDAIFSTPEKANGWIDQIRESGQWNEHYIKEYVLDEHEGEWSATIYEASLDMLTGNMDSTYTFQTLLKPGEVRRSSIIPTGKSVWRDKAHGQSSVSREDAEVLAHEAARQYREDIPVPADPETGETNVG